MGDGVIQFIRLMLDRGSVDQAARDAKAAGDEIGNAASSGMNASGSKGGVNYGDGFRGALLQGFDRARDTMNAALERMGLISRTEGTKAGEAYSNGFSSAIGKLAGALGIALGLRALVRFGEESVKTFSDFQSELNRTSITLQNFGVRFEDVRAQLDATQKKMQETAGVGPTAFYKTFNTLLTITGDYNKSLRATSVAVNFAVSRHLDFEQSARQVGRALEGSTQALQRQGIYLDKNRDVLTQLEERMGGEAAAKMQGFAGTILRAGAAWESFRITLGQAITQMGGGVSAGDMIVATIKSMDEWVRRNLDTIAAIGTVVGTVFIGLRNFFEFLSAAWMGARVAATAVSIGVGELKAGIELLGAAGTSMVAGILEGLSKLAPRFADAARSVRATANQLYADAKADHDAAVELNKHINDADEPGLGPVPVRASGDLGNAKVLGKQGPTKNADAELTKRIELLGKGLTMQDQAKASAAELDRIEAAQNEKLKNHNLTLEQRVTIENHIDEITKAREVPDTKLGREITTLQDRLKINEQDADARTRLLAIQAQLLERQKSTTMSKLEEYNVNKLLLQVNTVLTKDVIGPLQQQAELIKEMAQYGETRNRAQADAVVLLARVNEMLKAENLPLGEQIALLRIRNGLMKDADDSKHLRELEREAGALERLATRYKMTQKDVERLKQIEAELDKVINTSTDGAEVARARLARDTIEKTLNKYPLHPVDMLKDLKRMFQEELPQMAQGAAANMTNSFMAAFDKMITGSHDVRSALGDIAKGMANGIKKELADVAKSKVKENLAWSLEEGAKAIASAASQDWSGAAKHGEASLHFLGVAAEWGMLGAVSGGGGGASGGASQGGNTGGKTAATAQPNGPQIVLHVDGIDPRNTQHQELAGLAVMQYGQRTNGASFTIGG